MGGFVDRVCLVTGGSSGIGRAVAEAFAREGAKVLVAGRREELGEKVAAGIREAGGQARFVRTDVARVSDVEAMVGAAVEEWGRLDCAVNNAAVEGPGLPLVDVSEEEFDHLMAVNLRGLWACLRAELRQMSRQRAGAVVNLSSINALVAAPMASVYSASKQGVLALTRTAAVEQADAGIRVNAVCAGPTRTPMLERVAHRLSGEEAASILAESEQAVPMGRLGEPAEVASAVLWLCSEDASYVTGHALVVDGGLSAR